jgi:hypothetical protein
MDYLVIEVAAQEVCFVNLDMGFLPSSIDWSRTTFSDENLGIDLDDSLRADVRLLGVGMTAGVGIDGFGAFNTAVVDLATLATASDVEPVQLIDFDFDPGAGSDIYVAGNSQVNLVDYVTSDDGLEIGMELFGQIPQQEFGVNLEVCFSVSGEFRQGF